MRLGPFVIKRRCVCVRYCGRDGCDGALGAIKGKEQPHHCAACQW